MSTDTLLRLNEMFPGRKEQTEQLCRFFPENHKIRLCPYILLEGLPGSGRTVILKKLMEIRNDSCIVVNCIECYSPRLLYFHLLYGFFGEIQEAYEVVDSLGLVYNYFQKTEDKLKLRCIILKNSHHLDYSTLEQLCSFLKLLLQDGWNLSLVFISENSSHISELPIRFVRISFPLYDMDQLTEILMRNQKNENPEMYRTFLEVFLPSAVPIFRELPDLKRLAQKCFPIFQKPLHNGTINVDELAKLCRVALPHLKIKDFSIMYSYPEDTIKKETLHVMDLPLGTKYLLIAAYLASIVPKSRDKIFSRHSSKSKKRDGTTKKITEANKMALLGPKPFTFLRLIFIYMAIVDESTVLNIYLISQVAVLMELGLITPVADTQNGNITEPQYKCVANSTCVYAVSKNIEFEIEKYLVY